jgi:predicted RNA binding protein YcfA (HicA-like mRNA interferase family)
MSKKLPTLKPKKVIKALQRNGFQVRRITGSHYILKKESQTVSVPYHNKDLKLGTLVSIISQAGFTIEEFLDLL